MRHFVVSTESQNQLGLREICERYANEQWYAAHMSGEQAAEFKRAVRAELEMLKVECVEAIP